MKKNVLFLILLMAVCSLKAQVAYTTVNRFEGENITDLDISGAWNVQLTQGNATKVQLSFPERFKDQLILNLHNGELEIGFRGTIRSKAGEKFEAVIECSSLHEIDLSGACTLEGRGDFSGSEVKFDLSGAVKVNMNGRLDVAGILKLDLTGAVKAGLQNVIAPQFDIEQSGAASLQLAGKIGNGKLEVSGASKFDLSNLEMTRVNVELSGASKGSLNVSELITGEISGASRLIYSGNASTRVDVSGASTLKHQ